MMRWITGRRSEDRGRLLSNVLRAMLVVAVASVALPAALDAAVSPRLASAWVTNGPVDGVVAAGKTVYIRGRFTYVGPNSGSWVRLDPVSGALRRSPRITGGSVLAAVSDGAGGFYLGGSFSAVDGIARKLLAHVWADGSLDLSWNPRVSWDPNNDAVFALAVSGQTVYVGGSFDSIGGRTHYGIAALDARTGKATAWNPTIVYSFSHVFALAVSGQTVYVGGTFKSIGGQRRNGIAALDARTGRATAWNPHAPSDTDVSTLAVSGQTVYAGGSFDSIGGQRRHGLAALNARTGKATGWNPDLGSDREAEFGRDARYANTVAVRGSTVYVGGSFDSIGGQRRHNLAAVDARTGKPTAWNPSPNGFAVHAVAFSRSTVYVGGSFSAIGGQRRYFVAAVDARNGKATAWNPHSDNRVATVAVSGRAVYAGGDFSSVGGQTRRGIAALDARTGKPTAWNPDAIAYAGVNHPEGVISAFAVSGQTVYVSGSFVSIGGQTRRGIAALDARTGKATAWNPDVTPYAGVYPAQGVVSAFAVSGQTVYVIGAFVAIGGQPRQGIAALDARTGKATAWDANADAFQNADTLLTSGATVYVTGTFSSIGGQTRHGIAALDARTGKATAWNPKTDGTSLTLLAVSHSTIYVAGDFTSIGGQRRHHIAALDARTGKATSWNPRIDEFVQSLVVSGRTVYVGGSFRSVGGRPRDGVAAVDARTGETTAWNPHVASNANELAVAGGNVYIAGGWLDVTPALK